MSNQLSGGRNVEGKFRNRLGWSLVVLTVLVYWRVSLYGFINYDDGVFVFLNPHVYTGLTLANLKWSFSTLNGGATSYQPVTWLTHQLDCELFGLQPTFQHITNLWLHVANVVLLFTLLRRLTNKPWRSALVSALFAVHPLHIETVAWISERKTLVCTLSWLFTVFAYVRFVRQRALRNYLLVLAAYAAALLSKPIAVSLPFTLLLLDYWPLNRFENIKNPLQLPKSFIGHPLFRRNPDKWGSAPPSDAEDRDRGKWISSMCYAQFGKLLVEKLPMFLLCIVICCVTVLSQSDLGATKSLQEVPLSMRLNNTLVAYVLYLWKMVWPVSLAPIYPLRRDWYWWQVAGCGLLLVLISLWAVFNGKKRPYLLVGWGWYLVTLLPTIGLVQVGSQGMADRYSYVPLIGIFVSLVWEVSERPNALPWARPIVWAGAGGVVAACAFCTFVTVQYWQNSITLFQHAVRVTRDNYIAHAQLGLGFFDQGMMSEAAREFRESLRIRPNQVISALWLGDVCFQMNDYSGAFEQYSSALSLKPTDPRPHYKMASLLISDSRYRDAQRALNEARLACQLSRHRSREFEVILAQICADNNQPQEAERAAQRALELSVGSAEIRDVATFLLESRKTEAAKKKSIATHPAARQ